MKKFEFSLCNKCSKKDCQIRENGVIQCKKFEKKKRENKSGQVEEKEQ